jgi:dTDP-4-dehydrorhamnose 3,5-epimerase
VPFAFQSLAIPEVVLITPRVFDDERGFFMETYKRSDFRSAGITEEFVQDNHSRSTMGVIRGLHFQRDPHAQGKLVRATVGRLWDVAVDLRPGSKSFLKWVAEELNDQNRRMLYIPPGFAHGFAALTDEVHLQYKCTAEYNSDADGGIRWNDPSVGIVWPFISPFVSDKDARLPFANEVFHL